MADQRVGAAAAALLLLATLAAGCGDSGAGSAASSPATFVALDGSARQPDDAGVLTGLDKEFATLVLDGDTVYDVSPEVQSFASIDGSTQPLRGRVGQYVQVGLRGHTVVWVAGLGAVVRLPGKPDQVVYLGRISRIEGRRMELQDGTVLQVAANVAIDVRPTPDAPVAAVLTIDVASDRVIRIVSS